VGATARVHLGAEIKVDSELLSDLDAPGSTGVLPLAGTRYLLIELDRGGIGPDPVELTRELVLGGWRPILAHPELIPWLGENLALMTRLAEVGGLFQITAMSVEGAMGRRPRRVVERLLDEGLVHFLASDAHGERTRPPGLSAARATIAARYGEALAERLTLANPSSVLQDRAIASLHLVARSTR
jgi:protein-tyrosine phosphatase